MQTESLALDRVSVVTTGPSNPEATQIAVTWIKAILHDFQISGSKLAIKAGLATSTILRIINDKDHRFTPSLKTMQAIATAVDRRIPEEFLLAQNVGSSMISRVSPSEMKERSERVREARAADVLPMTRPVPQAIKPMRRQLTVRYVSKLPKSLHPAVFVGTKVECPPQMDDDPTAFAFYQPDAALAPAIPGGTLMYATKKRDPQVGEIVLLTAADGRSRVRIVKDISGDGLEVTKGGSFDDTETVHFDDIEELAVVAGTWRD